MFTWSYKLCNFCFQSVHFIYSSDKWLSNQCTLVWNNAKFSVRKCCNYSLKECPPFIVNCHPSWVILKIPRTFASHGVQFSSKKRVQINHHSWGQTIANKPTKMHNQSLEFPKVVFQWNQMILWLKLSLSTTLNPMATNNHSKNQDFNVARNHCWNLIPKDEKTKK